MHDTAQGAVSEERSAAARYGVAKALRSGGSGWIRTNDQGIMSWDKPLF